MSDLEIERTVGLDEGLLTDFFSRGGTFKELKNLSDDTMESVYSVGYNLYQSGKFVEATKVFKFLCFYDHYQIKYYLGLGACQMMMKRYQEALEFFGFAASMDQNDPRSMLYIGDCHLGLGNIPEAKIAYQQAVKWAGKSEEFSQEKLRAENMLSGLSGIIED